MNSIVIAPLFGWPVNGTAAGNAAALVAANAAQNTGTYRPVAQLAQTAAV